MLEKQVTYNVVGLFPMEGHFLVSDVDEEDIVKIMVAVCFTKHKLWFANWANVRKVDWDHKSDFYLGATVFGGNRMKREEAMKLWPQVATQYKWFEVSVNL